MNVLYTATATATGGREGRTITENGPIDLPLSMPKGLGGNEAPGSTNPEQLFAAGYAACFGGALGLVARMQKVAIGTPKITANVSIGKDETGGVRPGGRARRSLREPPARAGAGAHGGRAPGVPVQQGDAGEHRGEGLGRGVATTERSPGTPRHTSRARRRPTGRR